MDCRLALVPAALALASCQPSVRPIAVARAQMSASVDLAIGRTAIVNGMRITPVAIVEDSRCPINARCVWAGRLVVLTAIDSPGGGETLQLTLEAGKPVGVYGVRLTLADARPAKLAGQALSPADYRFVYRFDRP